jgi:putative heme-binding domain-containing protein
MLLSLLPLCVPNSVALGQTRPLADASPEDLSRGHHLFNAQCAVCHGIGGAGGAGPSLQRSTLRHVADDAGMVDVIVGGVGGTEMPSFALILTADDAWRVAAYARSLGRVAEEPLPGDSERGRRVYAAQGCAVCHLAEGEGGVVGPNLTDVGLLRGPAHLRTSLVDPAAERRPGYLTVYIETLAGEVVRGVRMNEDVFWIHVRGQNEQVHSFRKSTLAQQRREFGQSLMPAYGSVLSAEELDDLVAYLASLRGVR